MVEKTDPVLIGGQAKAFDGTDPSNVSAENDAARGIFDMNRRQYVNTIHPFYWSFHTDVISGSTLIADKVIQADPGDGYGIFVSDIIISTSSITAGVSVFFEEGATKVLGPYFFEPAIKGRGASINFTTPKPITASTGLTMTMARDGGTDAEITVDVTGFVARVT